MSKIYRPVIPIWIEEEDMRLIDADALLKGREDHELISTHLIWNAPTIDAVEVVRCKDCTGCRFVGTYDTEFPCANCSRKTKDYYAKDEQTERTE